MRMMIINASTLAMVKTYWTRFAQFTLQQLMNVNNTVQHIHQCTVYTPMYNMYTSLCHVHHCMMHAVQQS